MPDKEMMDNASLQKHLAAVPFSDAEAAGVQLQRLETIAPQLMAAPDFPEQLLARLRHVASPERALNALERFLQECETLPDVPVLLASEHRLLDHLMTLFAGSQFLGDVLVRNPALLKTLADAQALRQPKLGDQFKTEASQAIASSRSYEQKCLALRRYQQKEFLRIGASDLFGFIDLPIVTNQLSRLSMSLVQVAIDVAATELSVQPAGFAVIAMGKLGGRELNYSSDIDLLFLAGEHDDVWQKLGQKVIDVLDRQTTEGFLYRVDMRLRPWGKAGILVPGLQETLVYFQENARLWEKQALVKGRFIAGDPATGLVFLRTIRPLIYAIPESQIRAESEKMKQRIEAGLKRKGKSWGAVKSGAGSIRDVEFVTQVLQLRFGSRYPEVRTRNTLDALARLYSSGLLPAEEFRVLTEGYTFLRIVEHHLQIMDYQQKHHLPALASERQYLARRLGFDGEDAGELLIARFEQHTTAIRRVFDTYISLRETPAAELQYPKPAPVSTASYDSVFDAEERAQHQKLLEQLGESQLAVAQALETEAFHWRVTIVGYDYQGQLSLIAGLLFVYGLNIRSGNIFTSTKTGHPQKATQPKPRTRWHPRRFSARRSRGTGSRRRIIDVFEVSCLPSSKTPDWHAFEADLNAHLILFRQRKQKEAQAKLASRVVHSLRAIAASQTTLLPVDIGIDNTVSDDHTVVRIDAFDTPGFLYELTNALSLNGFYIARVVVSSIGNRVHDTLYVTDASGNKITDLRKRQQLRAAIALVKHFGHLLPSSPNPGAAIMHFREFVSQVFDRDDWAGDLAALESPEVLTALARLLGVSDFLWQDFLRMQHENLFPVLQNAASIAKRKSRTQLRNELHDQLHGLSTETDRVATLNRFKDREMFRIDMRYIQNAITGSQQFSQELSDLAEVVLAKAFELAYTSLRQRFGEPRQHDGSICQHAVCALGKFGGREIGFASDIELMFVYEGDGKTDGDEAISNADFFVRFAERLVENIHAPREGTFEIDLRLRPHGKAGSKACSFSVFSDYFRPDGPAWHYERQALVKLRTISGHQPFRKQLQQFCEASLFTGRPFDATAMRAMREKQIRQLVEGGALNAKFSAGALVDIEFVVQGLQITHGAEYSELRTPETLMALRLLCELQLLDQEDREVLEQAYGFWRRVIEAMRMVHGHARDLTLPAPESDAFAFLARRLGYGANPEQLRLEVNLHAANVRQRSEKLLGKQNTA